MSAPKLVRQTNNPDTTAREPCHCCSCHEDIPVGTRVAIVDSMGAAALVADNIPEEMQRIIAQHIGLVEPQVHHSECANTERTTTTKSGRVSRPPVRLENETFISGSGFAGCDHYDWGYDGNTFRIYKPIQGGDLRDFVVHDEEQADPVELPEESEGEWDSDYTSDEGEEWEEEDFSHIEKAIKENRVKTTRGSKM